ncbi:hypothetical protein B5X24_HaOG208823, partial [Helicoverpa armigera]
MAEEEVTDQTEPQEDRLSAETEDDIKLTRRKKLTLFLSVYWRGLLCLLTPIILLLMLLPFPPQKYQWAGYTLCLMAVFWVTECIPLTITSFLPIVIFPLTGIMDTRTTCLCYINDTVLMFCGSMILAQAVEQSGLHQRLALHTISLIGYSHYRLLFAMSITTMFISMWITNTAASSMMVPIIFALLDVFEKQNLIQVYELDSDGVQVASDITTCYFCAASFSATIGGIGTLVGTATNLVFKGLFERAYPSAPEYLSFPKFSAFSIPYMLVLEAGLYFYMIFMYLGFLRPKTKAAQSTQIPESGVEAARNTVEETLKKMGKITFWEIMVIILFSGVVVMFFSRAPQIFYGWGDYISDYYGLNNNKFVQDSAAAFLVCFLMLLLPSNLDFFRNFYVS